MQNEIFERPKHLPLVSIHGIFSRFMDEDDLGDENITRSMRLNATAVIKPKFICYSIKPLEGNHLDDLKTKVKPRIENLPTIICNSMQITKQIEITISKEKEEEEETFHTHLNLNGQISLPKFSKLLLDLISINGELISKNLNNDDSVLELVVHLVNYIFSISSFYKRSNSQLESIKNLTRLSDCTYHFESNFNEGPIIKILAHIKVESHWVIFKFSLESIGKKHLISEKDKPKVKKYLNLLNISIEGNFVIDSVGNITYVVKTSPVLEPEYDLEGKLTNSLEVFKKCVSRVYNIIKTSKYLIPSIVYTEKIIELDDIEVANENYLISKIKSINTTLFNNLFHNRPTQIEKTNCFRYILSSYSKLQRYYKSIFEEILEVITELKNRNIFLVNCRFPIDQFSWYQHKISYNYEKPLCKVFTRNYPASDYMPNVLRNLTTDLLELIPGAISIKYLSCKLYRSYFFNYCMYKFEKSIAETRLNLYLKNRNDFFIEYSGIMRIENSDYLLAEFSLESNFMQAMKLINKPIIEIIFKFIKAIQVVLLKNTLFSAFDLDCLTFTEDEELKMILKCPEEIHEDYKAPEVKLGRVHRKSLIYSTGKVIKEWFILKEQSIPEQLEILIESCLKENPSSRPSIEAIKDCVTLINQ